MRGTDCGCHEEIRKVQVLEIKRKRKGHGSCESNQAGLFESKKICSGVTPESSIG